MTAFTEENLTDFFDRSSQFCQDEHNKDLLLKYIDHCTRLGYELTIESLAAHIKRNEREFHWLRSEQEIAAVRAAAKPEPPKQERLKGLTIAEKLYQVGVTATTHLSHADKNLNDQKQSSILKQMAKEAAKTQAKIERQQKIEEARNIVIYRAGRVSHGETADARRRALAALGVKA